MEKANAQRRLSNIKKALRKINKANRLRKEAIRQLKKERMFVVSERANVKDGNRAFEIIQAVSEKIQKTVYVNLGVVVNKCLRLIFKEPYKFKLEFVKQKRRTDAVFKFVRKNVEPSTKNLGGVADIASLALRLAVLSISLPKKRSVVVYDEPFLAVDKKNLKKLPELLDILSKEMKVQFIVATHEEEFGRTRNTIRIGAPNAIS